MALNDKKTPRKFIKDRTDNLLDETYITKASASMANDVFSQDPAYVDGYATPLMYHMDLMQEDIDELRRHVTEDISGGGGGLTETPLANMSARWQWNNTDSGERCLVGNISYGPFNYYSYSDEPSSTTLRVYDSRHAVDTTTTTEDAYKMSSYGVWCPNNGKKVKAKLSFRIASAPADSTWGISLWSAPDPTSGTVNTGTDPTITLRATSPDVTVTTNSVTYWTTTCTTTSNMNDVWILPLLENRSGTLTTNTFVYGQIALFLV